MLKNYNEYGAYLSIHFDRVSSDLGPFALTFFPSLCYSKRFLGEKAMYAIVQSGGKQYRVAPGDLVKVERLDGKVGDKVELTRVLLVQNQDNLLVGKPVLEQAKVLAEVSQQARSRKVIVFKKKRRKNYRRTKGHRQSFTELKITEIVTA
jgi:large subunit ribosomal protein L21